MNIEAQIRKVGDSLGIILPTEALQQLNGKEGTTVYLTDSGEGSVTINQSSSDLEQIVKLTEEGMDQYRNALNELAK
ncbi:AbrB/MazE/SpoVT family DNA-binding domain-containing protein [Roseibacillus persicicus]|uniref:AbrB/MazE/SpoVT family DNA-binding domain-containing protein n=1 Tax=Roseibacillus persicicus TaxID=454148 RepID=UPI00280EC8D5|nr:AbrB family transcriptional regulator [Roseibacillus persicicus]MDQ8191724.1 AbrB family transcriptional regulator [Roseibacillus persicicus]